MTRTQLVREVEDLAARAIAADFFLAGRMLLLFSGVIAAGLEEPFANVTKPLAQTPPFRAVFREMVVTKMGNDERFWKKP